jgi:hypothetical protein
MTTETTTAEAGRDFIRDIVQADLSSKKHSRIVTRFRRSRTATCTSAMPSRLP